jgi:hypothetical protein
MTTEEKLHNCASALLSIYDYLKLEDNNNNMRELNDETFTEMMFRKMKGYDVDLNELLGFTHLKPVKK